MKPNAPRLAAALAGWLLAPTGVAAAEEVVDASMPPRVTVGPDAVEGSSSMEAAAAADAATAAPTVQPGGIDPDATAAPGSPEATADAGAPAAAVQPGGKDPDTTAAPGSTDATTAADEGAPAPATDPGDATTAADEGAPAPATDPGDATSGSGPTEAADAAAPEQTDSTSQTAGEGAAVDAEKVAPAVLPSRPADAPTGREPRAWGVGEYTPLPQAPAARDPSTLTDGPWRGRTWLGLALAAWVPLAGTAPAAGSVVSVVGEVSLGWRLHRFVAVHSALSSFALDAASRTVTNPDGSVGEEVAFGRLTALDVATVRLYVPLPKRLEPWGEVGAGVGVRRAPFAGRRQAAGLARVGVGLDFWLAPSFTIGASAAYRLTVIGKAAGHGLRTGLDLGIHW